MTPVLCHFGERAIEPESEVDCSAVHHPDWVWAVENAGGSAVAFGRCRNCGERCDPEASAIQASLAKAFESASRKE